MPFLGTLRGPQIEVKDAYAKLQPLMNTTCCDDRAVQPYYGYRPTSSGTGIVRSNE